MKIPRGNTPITIRIMIPSLHTGIMWNAGSYPQLSITKIELQNYLRETAE